MQKTLSLTCATLIVLSLFPLQSRAQRAGEIALSDESVQLRYFRDTAAEPGRQAAELGFGLYWNEQRDFVANAGYLVEANRLRFNRLSFKIGPVAYAAMLNLEDTDIFGLALGAEIRYELLRRFELDLVGRANYAPDVLTFGSADRLWDASVRAQLPITDRVTGFGGYRLFEIDLLQGRLELEETAFLGIRYNFD